MTLKYALGFLHDWGPWMAGGGLALVLAYFLWLRWGARIFSRESRYEMRAPFPLVGRPDLVMQEWGGLLVVHDLKTRRGARIYDSDILQLSLYALLLRASTGRAVARHGFVRLSIDGGRRVELRRVELVKDDSTLLILYENFMFKAANPPLALMSAPPYLCARCGFNGRGCKGKAPAKR